MLQGSVSRCVVAWVVVAGGACGGIFEDDYAESVLPPSTPGGAWLRVKDPSTLGWNLFLLADARQFFDEINGAAMMIVEDGRLISAWGATKGRWYVASIRKSILSAQYGEFVDSGAIQLGDTLEHLGIDDVSPPLTASQRGATIEDLLTSSSHICHRTAADTPLDCPETPPEPGSQFLYNNFDFNVLGTIFRQVTRVDIFAHFDERFAVPLGMEDFEPGEHGRYEYVDASLHPAYVFDMTARDLARFGLLFLRNGQWDGTQIISRSWVRNSTLPRIATTQCTRSLCDSYGYMWWRTNPEAWSRSARQWRIATQRKGITSRGCLSFQKESC